MPSPFHGVRRFLQRVTRSDRQVGRDVDEEVAFHLDMKERELIDAGVAPLEAREAARRAFGDVALAREALSAQERAFERRKRRTLWLEEWARDSAHALRQMRRAPAFALLVVATLGLGVGSTTAIFSAVHAILLAPLPYREPERLVRILRETPGGVRQSASGGDFLEFQRSATTLSGLTSYYSGTGNLAGFGAPQRVIICRASANFLDVLGIPLLLGRPFTAAEDSYKAAEVALISEGTWQRLFGGDRGVIGRTVRMDGQSVEIIGVVPDGRGYPEEAEFWLPGKYEPQMMSDENRGASWLRLIGRLAPGATLDQANAELRVISRSISERFPDDRAENVSVVSSFADSLVGDVRQPLWVLLGSVALVLLIACTNVASLLLGRVMSREVELSVRTALGAGRARLTRQLLTESVTLGAIGALVGVVLSVAMVRLLVLLSPDLPRIGDVEVSGVVLAFGITLGLLTGLVFGVVPAWHVARGDLQGTLRSGGRGLTGSRRAGRVRSALVVSQLALAIVLLASAGLLMRTFSGLRGVDPGFATSNVTTFTVTLPQNGSFDEAYGGVEGQRQFLRSSLQRLESIQGVEEVGATFGLPLSPVNFTISFSVDGRPKPPAGEEPDAQLRVATPGYFSVMRIPLVRGRHLSPLDRHGAPLVIVVSEQLANQYFPGEDVIGKRLTFGWARDSSTLAGEVVGVVRDVKQRSLTEPPAAMAYVSADQWPVDELTFVLASTLPVATVGAEAARLLKEVDAELPLYDIQSADALVFGAMASTRFYLVVLAVFAALALALASLGIYGVVSFGVQVRTQEIGIRMALGASLRRVHQLVLRDGLRLVAGGVALGVAGALSVTGLLRGVLFGVRPTDPVTYIAVVAILVGAAVLACVLPARRAARIDPQRAIRAE